jgi:hypothetical protein
MPELAPKVKRTPRKHQLASLFHRSIISNWMLSPMKLHQFEGKIQVEGFAGVSMTLSGPTNKGLLEAINAENMCALAAKPDQMAI